MHDRNHVYWRRNLWLIGILLGVWFVVTFGTSYFAAAMSGIVIFGWPLPFYVGAQGALIVYVVIVWIYSRRMERLDDAHERAGPPDAG